MTEREEWRVPWGIAFRNKGIRDLTPQEASERREEQFRHETPLTEPAQARHNQFKADVRASLVKMSQSTVYIVDQLPRDLASWNSLENTNGRGLRALFLTRLAETDEALWEALDHLPANCEFTVTEQINLRPTAQVKGRRRGGNIGEMRSREEDSALLPVLAMIRARINQEPPRERLLRRWREISAAREERIKQEKHRLEWLPLHRRLSPGLFQDREAETAGPAKDILTFCGWQSATTFALEVIALLPNEITTELAQAFLADLAEREEEANAALAQATPESIWHQVEEGRSHAFSVLRQTASAFLIPGEHTPDQEEAFL